MKPAKTDKLKYEGAAEVGDRIRSHDFDNSFGLRDWYVEGVVESIQEAPYKAFKIVADASKEGAESNRRVGETFYCPMEVGFSDWDGRIENLSK